MHAKMHGNTLLASPTAAIARQYRYQLPSSAPITSPMHSSVYIGCVYRSESNSR